MPVVVTTAYEKGQTVQLVESGKNSPVEFTESKTWSDGSVTHTVMKRVDSRDPECINGLYDEDVAKGKGLNTYIGRSSGV